MKMIYVNSVNRNSLSVFSLVPLSIALQSFQDELTSITSKLSSFYDMARDMEKQFAAQQEKKREVDRLKNVIMPRRINNRTSQRRKQDSETYRMKHNNVFRVFRKQKP
jgi:hypothetical protein